MKSEVSDLPPKIDETHELFDPTGAAIHMSALQRKLYSEAVIAYKRAKEQAAESEQQAGTLTLALLRRLRVICSNPLAVAQEGADRLPVAEQLRHSSKLQWLVGQLEKIRQRDEKVIIFTEYREMQRLVQKVIAERFEVDASIVSGSVNTPQPSWPNGRSVSLRSWTRWWPECTLWRGHLRVRCW